MDVDYRTELTFTVDGMVGRETRVRAEYDGGKVFTIGVVRPDGKLELVTRFGNDTSGVLKMGPLELVRSDKVELDLKGINIGSFSGGGNPPHQDHDRWQGVRDERCGLVQDAGGHGAAERRVLDARRSPRYWTLAANW